METPNSTSSKKSRNPLNKFLSPRHIMQQTHPPTVISPRSWTKKVINPHPTCHLRPTNINTNETQRSHNPLVLHRRLYKMTTDTTTTSGRTDTRALNLDRDGTRWCDCVCRPYLMHNPPQQKPARDTCLSILSNYYGRRCTATCK